MNDGKQNIRYLGFENTSDGGRRFDFAITGVGQSVTRVSMEIPIVMFSGTNRISFQESAKICYEKLRTMLQTSDTFPSQYMIRLTGEDIARFRHVPRGKARPRD
jgi:hypothetical protein